MKKILFCLVVLMMLVSCSYDIVRDPVCHFDITNYSGSTVYIRVYKVGDTDPTTEQLWVGAYRFKEAKPDTEYIIEYGFSEDDMKSMSITTYKNCNDVHFRLKGILVCEIRSI